MPQSKDGTHYERAQIVHWSLGVVAWCPNGGVATERDSGEFTVPVGATPAQALSRTRACGAGLKDYAGDWSERTNTTPLVVAASAAGTARRGCVLPFTTIGHYS